MNRKTKKKLPYMQALEKSQISKYERGENQPKLEIAVLIAECLGVTVDEMIDSDGETA